MVSENNKSIELDSEKLVQNLNPTKRVQTNNFKVFFDSQHELRQYINIACRILDSEW